MSINKFGGYDKRADVDKTYIDNRILELEKQLKSREPLLQLPKEKSDIGLMCIQLVGEIDLNKPVTGLKNFFHHKFQNGLTTYPFPIGMGKIKAYSCNLKAILFNLQIEGNLNIIGKSWIRGDRVTLFTKKTVTHSYIELFIEYDMDNVISLEMKQLSSLPT